MLAEVDCYGPLVPVSPILYPTMVEFVSVRPLIVASVMTAAFFLTDAFLNHEVSDIPDPLKDFIFRKI